MLRVEKINKIFNPHRRNKNQVLNNVSFSLPKTGLICIYGKSGSGKTTLLNILGGLDRQGSGKIYLNDQEITASKVDYNRNQNIGFVFQNYYLERGYTIEEIMHNAMVIAGFKDEEEIKRRTHEVLELVDMERFKHKQGDSLSGGQKQRVAIARGLIKGADIILADEPTGNLDANNTMKIMDIFKEISKTRLVVIVTHEVTLIKKYADSYIELVDGKLTDDDVIGEVFKYETEKNHIYIDKNTKHELNDQDVSIETYGNPKLSNDDLKLYEKDGKVYLTYSSKVNIITKASEKQIIFTDDEEKTTADFKKEVPVFEKSKAKKNGKLFKFKNILRNMKADANEKAYSTSNIFKQIFIAAISLVMVFFSMMVFEVTKTDVKNKTLNADSYYVNLNSFEEIKKLDDSKYQNVDFFETKYRTGKFNYSNFTVLSGVEAMYSPEALDLNANYEFLIGKMPEAQEVLITEALAKELKKAFRIQELDNLKAMLLVNFEKDYRVSGVIKGNEPMVYLPKEAYINFLGVYDSLQFIDVNEIFFKKDFIKNTYKTEILLMDDYENKSVNEVEVSLSRNALYKMVNDTTLADYKVQEANSVLRSSKGRTSLELKNSNFYVKKLSITREPIKTDIQIFVHPKALENIFVYLEPNVNVLKQENAGNYYFELTTKNEEEREDLGKLLAEKRISLVDIKAEYNYERDELIKENIKSLNVFLIIMVLLFVIYYFIEKSGSLKNSKEYGIYRAIGVNKSNLLFKETIQTLVNNLITYLIFFILGTCLIFIRYQIMNINSLMFVLISFITFIISSLILVGISLIPYLFVIRDTPSKILSRYDI